MIRGTINPTEFRRLPDEAHVVTCDVDEARNLTDLELPLSLMEAIDEAQAPVFDGQTSAAFVIIKIVPAVGS